jgi:hypothetical protein
LMHAWSQFYKHNPMTRFINCILFYCKPGRIATIDCYDWTLFGLNDCFKMCECFKNENGIFWKMSKELGRWDGRVCVRSMGELVPLWLSMFGDVHLVVKDRVAWHLTWPNFRTTTRLLYVATA